MALPTRVPSRPGPPGPTVTRARLRMELRNIREDLKLTLEEVTSKMEWSVSKLIRIENGSVAISVNDLKMLLELYQVTDRSRVEELLDLARVSRQRMWWSKYRTEFSAGYLKFIAYEADASRILNFEPLVVPGLLQTESYAHALVAGLGSAIRADTRRASAIVKARMERQQAVLGGSRPAAVTAVLDEAVLRRPVSGIRVMREQLDRLIELNGRPNIDIVVVPNAIGAHPGLVGAFSLLQFGVEGFDVLFVEHAGRDLILKDRSEELATFGKVVDHFLEIGLRDHQVTQFIRQVASELE